MKIKTSYRPTILTFVGYIIAYFVGLWLEKLSPSGPCTPGLGIIFFLLMPIPVLGFFFVSLLQVLHGRKRFVVPLVLHVAVLLGFGVMMTR